MIPLTLFETPTSEKYDTQPRQNGRDLIALDQAYNLREMVCPDSNYLTLESDIIACLNRVH